MSTVMSNVRQYHEEALPDTMARRLHDQAQDLIVKLRRIGHGWPYLPALELFELNITGLAGKLDMLTTALEPRFASKTMVTKTGAWFDGLERAQSKPVRIDDVVRVFCSLYPDAERLKELCRRLLQSAKWSVDLEAMMEYAIASLGDFVESRPLRARIGWLEARLRRERD